MTEAQRIRLARQGDQTAWEALMHAHQEPVFRLAYLLLGDPDEAEDIAQETFLRAHKALRRFDIERPMRPWLLRIASNLAKNRHRSIGRYISAFNRFIQQDPERFNPAGINTDDESQALWQAVRKMTRPFQEVVYLRYFLDMSESEMAESLDVPAGTVKSRLHRALINLRGIIENDYPELKEIVE